jgi:hypothetical protein
MISQGIRLEEFWSHKQFDERVRNANKIVPKNHVSLLY